MNDATRVGIFKFLTWVYTHRTEIVALYNDLKGDYVTIKKMVEDYKVDNPR